MLLMHKVFLKILFLIPVVGYANDPFEEINREVWTFNEGVDNRIARPVAEFYDGVVPVPIQSSITNFFSNLDEIDNSINQILQGKPIAAANDLGRFIINTSFGILGFFDVASIMGFEEHDEDFGQTLGVWGIPSGPYLMLPFYGPSSPRDLVGRPISGFLSGTFSIEESDVRASITILDALETRARLLDVESLIVGDKYTFIKNSYLQYSEFEVQDGEEIEDDFTDDMDDFLLDD
jgi:phospholipid-binding lipoprotein MlaA